MDRFERFRPVLRPVVPQDLPDIYRWVVTPGLGDRWRYQDHIPDLDGFVKGFHLGALDQRLVLPAEHGVPAGLVTAYNANHRSGTCYVAALSSVPGRLSPTLGLGVGYFVESLFREWRFRKVYAEVYSYNQGPIAAILKRVGSCEAVLRRDLRWGDDYFDRHILSVTAAQWTSYCERTNGFRDDLPNTISAPAQILESV